MIHYYSCQFCVIINSGIIFGIRETLKGIGNFEIEKDYGYSTK